MTGLTWERHDHFRAALGAVHFAIEARGPGKFRAYHMNRWMVVKAERWCATLDEAKAWCASIMGARP